MNLYDEDKKAEIDEKAEKIFLDEGIASCIKFIKSIGIKDKGKCAECDRITPHYDGRCFLCDLPNINDIRNQIETERILDELDRKYRWTP